jgi:hypothetical protein
MISWPAPSGKACKCKKKILWNCDESLKSCDKSTISCSGSLVFIQNVPILTNQKKPVGLDKVIVMDIK